MKQVEQEEIIEMEGDKKDETLPPGFRFHPSDEELITYYLVNKISISNFTARAIVDVDLNKSEPWDLPGKAKMGENEWYFFNLRDRKYPTGVRTNRATNIGYWKTTGKDKEIFNNITSELIGMKKTLVFYRGRAPRGEKTNWIMHEYRIPSKSNFKIITKDEWVVCRVFQKSAGAKRFPRSSSQLPRAVNMNPPYNFQFPTDRLAELTRMFRGCASTSVNNLPIQSPMNCVPLAGSFTVSGLNLNFGGATTQPPVLPPQEMNQQDVMMTSTSYAAEINQANAASGSRYTRMEHCMDLDGYYWPPY